MLDRVHKLRQPIGRSAKILEVGPSFNPIAPRSEGWQSFIVDHASKWDLVEKYKSDQAVDITKIEAVDFIWRQGYLHDSLPQSLLGTFDVCLASHVIEHIPDFIGFFLSLERILHQQGVISLAVPDKRFCFDYFKPITTTGELLAAHANNRMRHSKKTAFDQFAYNVRNGDQIAWGQHPPGEFTFITSLADAHRAFNDKNESNQAPYVDFHAWYFTPASFELIVLELAALDVFDFHIAERFATEGPEFIVVLRKGRTHFASEAALQAQRLALLKGTLMDTREQISYLLDHGVADKSLVDTLTRRLDGQAVYLRDIAEVAAWVRKMLRPLRAAWLCLLPMRRSVARLRGRL
jgi:SAM-dependent methyltransferase